MHLGHGDTLEASHGQSITGTLSLSHASFPPRWAQSALPHHPAFPFLLIVTRGWTGLPYEDASHSPGRLKN